MWNRVGQVFGIVVGAAVLLSAASVALFGVEVGTGVRVVGSAAFLGVALLNLILLKRWPEESRKIIVVFGVVCPGLLALVGAATVANLDVSFRIWALFLLALVHLVGFYWVRKVREAETGEGSHGGEGGPDGSGEVEPPRTT